MPFLYYLTDGVPEFTAGGFQLITTAVRLFATRLLQKSKSVYRLKGVKNTVLHVVGEIGPTK